jgi:hypothetical protein
MEKKRAQRKEHAFQGEEDGQSLAEFLNGPPSDAQKNIEAIVIGYIEYIEILHVEQEMRERHGWGRDTVLGKIGIGYKHEQSEMLEKLWKNLRDRLRRYRGCLAPGGRPSAKGGIRMEFLLDEAGIDDAERQALTQIQRLLMLGLLTRLRRCQNEPCKRWFYARFGHQRSHSDECRIAHAQSGPKWNEDHKARRRNYYQRTGK